MIKKCAVFILIALLSFVRVSFVQADSGRMYEIINLTDNGDFTSGYDYWGTTNATITGGKLIFNSTSSGYVTRYPGYLITTYATHTYYISFNVNVISRVSGNYGVRFGNEPYQNLVTTSTGNQFISGYIVKDATDNGLLFGAFTTANGNAEFDNLMIIDVTSIFGYGNEPSLSDFELYYLPDMDYFDYYNSFDPTSYTQLNTTDYTNITTDLTGIDYSKSIIARNGDNMNLDFYAYFYDSPDATGSGLALHYYNYNRPEMRYLGTDHALLWEYSDYSDRVLKLSLTDEQSDILKTILFNRVVDPDNEYFEFRIDAYFWDYVKIYVVMTSTFDLLVDVKSFMISRETVTLNDFNINNEMNVKTYDQNGDLYLPIIKLNLAGDNLETRVIDGFGSGYTRISRFNFEFEFTSPENDDPYAYELQYLYELGIFSSDDVLIPTKPTIPEYLDGIFPYQVCDAFQIGCHIKNGINDIVLWLWDALNINAIIAVFDSVILAVGSLVSLIPGGLSSLVLVFTGIIGIGIIITIYDRITKGGGD